MIRNIISIIATVVFTSVLLATPVSSLVLNSIQPNRGSVDGGNEVSIQGEYFANSGKNASSVSIGWTNSCAIINNQAYCWGAADTGQLGNGSYITQLSPTPIKTGDSNDPKGSAIPAGKVITQIASAGNYHSCAIAADNTYGLNGKVYCWGAGSNGRLGTGDSTSSSVPVEVKTGDSEDPKGSAIPAGKTVTKVSVGLLYSCAVVADNADGDNSSVYCWGYNNNGQLGNGLSGNASTSLVPVRVLQGEIPIGSPVDQLSSGDSTNCILSLGKAYCWGNNDKGQAGVGATTAKILTPKLVVSGQMPVDYKISKVVAGSHSCAIADSTPYCWGSNNNSTLGNGQTTNTTTPVKVSLGEMTSLNNTTDISAGFASSCAISQGSVYCWGSDGDGSTGSGQAVNAPTPVKVKTGNDIDPAGSEIPAGKVALKLSSENRFRSCAIYGDTLTDITGSIYCWGTPRLGNGIVSSSLVPLLVDDRNVAEASPTVSIGGSICTDVVIVSTTEIKCKVSASTSGIKDVVVKNGDSASASLARSYTFYDIPTVPLAPKAFAGDKLVNLSWDAPSSDNYSEITDYRIEYSTDNITWVEAIHSPSIDTNITIRGLSNGAGYFFRVAAINEAGQGPYSDQGTADNVTAMPSSNSTADYIEAPNTGADGVFGLSAIFVATLFLLGLIYSRSLNKS